MTSQDENDATVALDGPGWQAIAAGDGFVVTLSGDWIAQAGRVDSGRNDAGPVLALLRTAPGATLRFEAEGLGRWDSALLVFVTALRDAAHRAGSGFEDGGLPAAARRLLALVPPALAPARPAPAPRLLVRLGTAALRRWAGLADFAAFIGEMVLRLGAALTGRLALRGRDLLACIGEAGADALAIVAIVNMLVGGILAFVGAIQLRKFGADIYVANLVGIAVVREMAPLMTAIVMAGRTGGAYAAHIATMEGNEEIDALRAIGIPVFDYLLLPRIGALCFTMPFLYLYGAAVSLAGGFLVAVMMLHLTPLQFISHVRNAVNLDQVLFGLAKSLVFGAAIAVIGCRTGLAAGRSAADVGRAATGAVVAGIVWVIALDAVFAVCANALHF